MEQAPIDPVRVERQPRFDPPDIVWYFGALVAAIAGDVLIGGTSSAHRGVWILLVGLGLMAAFGVLSAAFHWLGRRIAGGVLAAAVVWLVPPTGVGFERLVGVHPGVAASSYSVQVGTVGIPAPSSPGGFHGAIFALAMSAVVVGLVVFWLVRFAFVLLPVAIALAISALLFLPAVVSHAGAGDYIATALVTGIVFCVLGLVLDARLYRREAFWWYVIGLLEIAVAFAYYLARHHGWVWFVLLVVAAAVLIASAPVSRAVWAVYAVLGIYAAIAHYADDVTGSWRTSLALVIVGLVIVAAGTLLDLTDSSLVARITRPVPWLRRQPPP